MSKVLRNIPSVSEILERPPIRRLMENLNRNVVVGGIREFLENLRDDVQQAAQDLPIPQPTELAERIADWIRSAEQPRLRPVINATGIMLHTGLGRAPLSKAALAAIGDVAGRYCNLEIDLASGDRSQRVLNVEHLLRKLTGAEAATVVNNNAAATLITLAAVAAPGEVIVSRGQLVEIGGSYRLPDVMATSGVRLREVGTTNKTRIGDYREAIVADTSALLRVHTSNYVVMGFSEEASLKDLVDLSHRRHLPLIDDIGSGSLIDMAQYGLRKEPLVQDSIRAGADLVLFSGDKLLGGPQAGIIVGKKQLVEKIQRHPFMRAMRVDKLTLAALAATLRLYLSDQAATEIPLLSMLNTSVENLENRARRLAPLCASSAAVESAEPICDVSYVGGGSVPTAQLPTWCIALKPAPKITTDGLARLLRQQSPAVMGRIQQERLLLDLRTVDPAEDTQLCQSLELAQPSAADSNDSTGTADSAEVPADSADPSGDVDVGSADPG